MIPFLRIAAIFVAVSLLGSSAQAEPSLVLPTVAADTLIISTSNDLIAAIMSSNRSYEVYRLRADAAQNRSNYASVYPDPMVMVTGQPLPVYTARGKQIAGIRIEQSIPFPGRLDIMHRIAELEADMGRNAANHYVVDVILEAQLAFNEIRHGQELQRIIRSFSPRLDELEAIATSKYEGGEGTQQSLFKIQLEKARLDQMWLEQERVIRSAANQIERMVQEPVSVKPPEPFREEMVIASLDLAGRSDLKMLEQSLNMAEEKRTLLDFYNKPDFTLSVNWIAITKADTPPTSDGRDALALGVGVRIPLWPSGNKARKQEASLLVEASQKQFEATSQAIEDLYKEVRTNMDSDKAIIKLIETSLLVTADAVSESAISSYSTGLASFMDLLDAERSLFQLKMDRTHVQARLSAGALMLNRISGRLNRSVSEMNR